MAQRLFKSVLRDLVNDDILNDVADADRIVDIAGMVLDHEEPSTARFIHSDRELESVRESLNLAVRGLIVRGKQRNASSLQVQQSISALLDNYERYLTFRVLHLRRR